MTQLVAVKRLAEVEVDHAASNQHEFNAGRLRKELGFDDSRTEGTVRFFFYVDDDESPTVVDDEFTLYDAREATPGRTEWRLYYKSRELSAHAKAGDLLILLRNDSSTPGLIGVVIRSGTRAEREISRQLLAGGVEAIKSGMAFVESRILDQAGVVSLLAPFRHAESDQPPLPYDYRMHPLYLNAVRSGDIPSTASMALAAQEIVREVFPHGLGPDEFIEQALGAESELFFAIEDAIGNDELMSMLARDEADFAAVMKFALSYSQSRKSRRGESLQNHFSRLLDNRGIGYTPQCLTERGETPDFIMPGYDAYHDRGFPDGRLRMVGCKTILRERYSQWLKEADRIRVKFGLCVDSTLTDQVIKKYEGQLRLFMPRATLESYSGRATRSLLGSVGELVDDLEAAAGG